MCCQERTWALHNDLYRRSSLPQWLIEMKSGLRQAHSSQGLEKTVGKHQHILGTLFFLLYINDLANVSSKLFSLFFADDSDMFLSGRDPDQLIKSMREETIKIVDWLRLNKLSLNLK